MILLANFDINTNCGYQIVVLWFTIGYYLKHNTIRTPLSAPKKRVSSSNNVYIHLHNNNKMDNINTKKCKLSTKNTETTLKLLENVWKPTKPRWIPLYLHLYRPSDLAGVITLAPHRSRKIDMTGVIFHSPESGWVHNQYIYKGIFSFAAGKS